jgi:hypothetical protein
VDIQVHTQSGSTLPPLLQWPPNWALPLNNYSDTSLKLMCWGCSRTDEGGDLQGTCSSGASYTPAAHVDLPSLEPPKPMLTIPVVTDVGSRRN